MPGKLGRRCDGNRRAPIGDDGTPASGQLPEARSNERFRDDRWLAGLYPMEKQYAGAAQDTESR